VRLARLARRVYLDFQARRDQRVRQVVLVDFRVTSGSTS
jgi:hypothetical protein